MHFCLQRRSLHHSHLLICHFICADEHPNVHIGHPFAGGLIDFVLNGVCQTARRGIWCSWQARAMQRLLHRISGTDPQVESENTGA